MLLKEATQLLKKNGYTLVCEGEQSLADEIFNAQQFVDSKLQNAGMIEKRKVASKEKIENAIAHNSNDGLATWKSPVINDSFILEMHMYRYELKESVYAFNIYEFDTVNGEYLNVYNFPSNKYENVADAVVKKFTRLFKSCEKRKAAKADEEPPVESRVDGRKQRMLRTKLNKLIMNKLSADCDITFDESSKMTKVTNGKNTAFVELDGPRTIDSEYYDEPLITSSIYFGKTRFEDRIIAKGPEFEYSSESFEEVVDETIRQLETFF